MHPADADARGLADGASVRLRSQVGELRTEIRHDADLMPGVVCLPHGFGHRRTGVRLALATALAGESYNDLSDPAALDLPSGNAALNGLEVWVDAATA